MKKNVLAVMLVGLTFSVNSQTLVATDDLGVIRTKHQAVLMNNGNVLCFGGNDGYASNPVYYTSAEIYNTGTNTWSNTGSMTEARDNFASALLPNGKVIAIGGKNSVTSGLSSCEIFDPGTNTWSAGPSLNYGRWGHKAVTLQNGKILVAGGDDNYGISAEIYDPGTNTWTLTTDMQYEHGQYSSLVVLTDGKVLCTGGWFASPNGTIAEVYDPVLDTWTAVGDMTQDRSLNHSSVLLNNGKVLIIGGTSSGSADLFDPLTGTFSATGNPNAAKNHGIAFRLNNGDVFAFSKGSIFYPTYCLEIYSASGGTWSGPSTTFYGQSAGAGVVLNNGQIFIIGGNVSTGNGALKDCYLVNGITAGIENQTIISTANFSVYPNPAEDQITIETAGKNDYIEIIDASGRIISADTHAPNGKLTLDISHFEPGVYICKCISTEGQFVAKQFIVH